MKGRHNYIFVVLFFLMLSGIPAFVKAESSLSWRVFGKDANTWVFHPNGLMLFSTLSRTIKPVPLDVTRNVDTLIDCIEYDGALWVSTNAGVYQVDMASQSIERLPQPPDDSAACGKLGQDPDYLWMGTGRTLLRFDKLGREWFSFSLPQAVENTIGIWSNGEEVFYLGSKVLYRFTISTEKWNPYPVDKEFGRDAVFYPGADGFKVLDKSFIFLYQPASFSWVKTEIGSPVVDLIDKGNVIYFTDGTNVKLADCLTGMVKPLVIPNVGDISAIALAADSIIMVMPKRTAAFSLTKETVNFMEYEKDFTLAAVQKALPVSLFNVIVTSGMVVVYEKKTKAWQYIPRASMRRKAETFSWNEQECVLRYGAGVKSSVNGYIETDMSIKTAGRNRDSLFLYNMPPPVVQGDITIHTSDSKDRVMDVFLKNDSKTTAPRKGIYYRGNRNDYLNTVKLGSTDNEQMASLLLPKVSVEGGSVVAESRKALEERDRKIARLAGGAGYISSRTVTRTLPYRPDGLYKLKGETAFGDDDTAGISMSDTAGEMPDTAEEIDSVRIIPGSFRVIVDGIVLDSGYYSFYAPTNTLQFKTTAPIDPASAITVEYQVQTIPKGKLSNIEFIPSRHFGKLYYGAFTFSPTEWISARVGYTGIDRDSLSSVVSASTPLEFRSKQKNFMLKANPEFSYNVVNKTKAGGMSLQSRIGAGSGLLFNCRFIDSNFISTDTLTRGIGAIRSEYDFNISHDIRQELPVGYYQHSRVASSGSENRFELRGGAHFSGFPFVDVNVSRTLYDKADDVSVNNVFDTLFHKKDKLYIRLYETSSPLAEKLTKFRKIAYDLGHSEYRTISPYSEEWKNGRVSSLQFNLIPIQNIILLGNILYRFTGESEPDVSSSDLLPSLTVQMIDFPKGIDITGFYYLTFQKYNSLNTSTDTINRTINLLLKPGQWYKPLGWFTPRVQISQKVMSGFSSTQVSPWNVLTGSDGERTSDIVKEIGVNVFPVEGMLLSNTNRWSGKSMEIWNAYQTNNRLQVIFDARNSLTGTYNFMNNKMQHNLLLMYDRILTSWLRTTPMVALDSKTDRIGNEIKAGPGLSLNLNIMDFGLIRMLNNSHDLQMRWRRIDGETVSDPEIQYMLSLIVKMKPNVELANREHFEFGNGKLKSFKSVVNLFIYF